MKYIIGILLGISLEAVSFLISGYGHGITIPIIFSLGPFSVMLPFAWNSPSFYNFFIPLTIGLVPLLYCLYSYFLFKYDDRIARFKMLTVIGGMHYFPVIILSAYEIINSNFFTNFSNVLKHSTWPLIAFIFIFFVANGYFIKIALKGKKNLNPHALRQTNKRHLNNGIQSHDGVNHD